MSVRIPTDIERVRRDDPAEARRWRLQVREQLTELLDAQYRIVGFDRAEGYIVRPEQERS